MSGFHHCSSELYIEPPLSRLASGWLQFTQPSLSLATAAALCAFWSAGERVLRKLVKHLELDELGSMSSFPLLLEAMIRHFHPGLDDTQMLQALMRRSPERENQLQTVVCEEDFKEVFGCQGQRGSG